MLYHNFMRTRKIFLDIIIISILPVASSVLILVFKLNFLESMLLFYATPSVYLSFRTKNAIPRSLIFALLWAIPTGFVIDYLVGINNVWYVPASPFPRLFNLIPLEDLLWAFLISYLIVIFYEHFDDKCRGSNVKEGNIKTLIAFGLVVLSVFIVVRLINPSLLSIPYFYLFGGIIFILLPLVLFYSRFSSTVNKFIHTGIYLLAIAILHEITGLRNLQWIYPSREYIGWVSMFGTRFPYEELVFFIFLLAPAVLAYYEFLADNKR